MAAQEGKALLTSSNGDPMQPEIQKIDNINLEDNFNPAEKVYDVDGYQIYKNKDATIMVKVLSTSPRKFIAIFHENSGEL